MGVKGYKHFWLLKYEFLLEELRNKVKNIRLDFLLTKDTTKAPLT